MKRFIITSLVGTVMAVGAGLANAAEPMALTDNQMDAVSAGALVSVSYASGSVFYGLTTAGTSTRAFAGYGIRATGSSGAALSFGIGARATSVSGSAIF